MWNIYSNYLPSLFRHKLPWGKFSTLSRKENVDIFSTVAAQDWIIWKNPLRFSEYDLIEFFGIFTVYS